MSKNDFNNDRIFLDPFDLNGDGRTDGAELLVMLQAVQNAEIEGQKSADRSKNIIDIDDLDIDGI